MSRTNRHPHHPAVAPEPSVETTPRSPVPPEHGPAPAARGGRQANGRFAKGNQGGPGNPFARQVAALRRQLVAAVTPEVMAQVCTALILRAQGGNLPAIKLLFSYVLGQPAETVNPDALDREEMEQYRRDIGMDELMGKVLLGVPADFACECVRAARPDIIDRLIEKATHGGAAGAEANDRQAVRSANGMNRGPQGDDTPPGDSGDAPTANGENGAAEVAAGPDADPAAEEGAPKANGRNRPRRARRAAAGPRQTRARGEPGTEPASARNPAPRRPAGAPATAPPSGGSRPVVPGDPPGRCPSPGE